MEYKVLTDRGNGSPRGTSLRLLQIIDGYFVDNNLSDWLWRQYNVVKDRNGSSIVRISCECEAPIEAGTDITDAFLTNSVCNNSKLFSDCSQSLLINRNLSLSLIGYGTCARFDSIEDAKQILRDSSEVVAVGGQDFSLGKNGVWSWLVPRIEIRSSHDETNCSIKRAVHWPRMTISINIILQASTTNNILDVQKDWRDQLRQAKRILQVASWEFRPQIGRQNFTVPPILGEIKYSGMNEEQYLQAVRSVVAAMDPPISDYDFSDTSTDNCSSPVTESDSVHSSPIKSSFIHSSNEILQKVVYALRRTGQASSAINAAALLQLVAESNQTDHGKRYYFFFAPNGRKGQAFISLSPELLCRVEGKSLETEALAGTFPAADPHMADQFEADDKTSREHSVVSDFAFETLSLLKSADGVQIKERNLLRLKDVIHLKRTLSVTVSDDSNLEGVELLSWARENLHPTPAVCGVPTQLALSLIQRNEKFDRGLYSSSCGFISKSGGELFVGLRSALVDKATVHVFAGAGIVAGSVPKDELAEINLKMAQYLRVLTSIRRPAMAMEFPNATAAAAAIVVEEMIRQGVGAFCVCPGSRSTPLAVAIYRNTVSRATVQVVHDERSAGFYALGCARSGVLCAVLVTSGTAASNLLPAVSEARESALPIVLLTTDRPSESRDVGEAQTIHQQGMFGSAVGWERDFPPWESEAPQRSAALTASLISDISFAVGEIARRRNRVVHLNFQYRKAELQPEVVIDGFKNKYCSQLPTRVTRWLANTRPYTHHCRSEEIPTEVKELLFDWISGSWKYWSIVVVAGELRSAEEALDLNTFCQQFSIPCICDATSMLQSTNCNASESIIFNGVDRLTSSRVFMDSLSASIRVVLFVGGSIISAKIIEWMGQSLPLAKIIRVRDDWGMDARHDATWSADYYVHSRVGDFIQQLSTDLIGEKLQNSFENVSDNVCDALHLLRTVELVNREDLKNIVEDEGVFSEPKIARTLHEVLGSKYSPIFLSSSMACRDFDNFGNSSGETGGNSTLGVVRRIGCNRGANGIDGVLSTAAGFAACSATEGHPVTVLIGDIATLHDISGLGIAAGCQPVNMSYCCALKFIKVLLTLFETGKPRSCICLFKGRQSWQSCLYQ